MWWYGGVGSTLALTTAFVPDSGVRLVAYLGAIAHLPIVALVATKRYGLHRRWPALVALVSALHAATAVTQTLPATTDTTIPIALGAAASCCVAAGLVKLLRNRHSGGTAGLISDGLIVGLGAWVVSWVVFITPLIVGHQHSVLSMSLAALSLPTSALTLYLVVVLLFGSGVNARGLMTLSAAVMVSLAGDVLLQLVNSHQAGTVMVRAALPLYVVAYFLIGAMFMHSSVTRLGVPQSNHGTQRLLGRLIITTTSLVASVIVLAASGPQSIGDALVRSSSAVVLAGAVTLRVVQSVRANSRTHDSLLRDAHTDPLTGLPNRTLLLEHINACVTESWQLNRQPTLFFIDLDRFKNVNDSLGHEAGDELLVLVAERLRAAVPAEATVARLSGDEFVVLDPAAPSTSVTMALAERLLAVFREPLALKQGDVFITASIGVAAMSPTSSSTAEDLLRHSDTAMYRAKDNGRNCVALYDESMHERVAHRLATETALYRAIDRRELRMFHQPILDIESGDVVGFEALMRWQHADGTMVPPIEFIPIAEETGIIVPIGSWALLESLSQLRTWIDEGVCRPTATMSVNVSPRQLRDPNFPAIVAEAISRSDVPASLVWLEVTESIMIVEPELALATLKRLRSLGVRVALDDFGTGYSSLSLLQKFPLQRIKIDRAFVQGVADNPNDRALVRTIVAMGKSLGLDMVAEGVETIHQLQVLHELGCSKAQGYLISHPVPAEAMATTVAGLERLGRFTDIRVPEVALVG